MVAVSPKVQRGPSRAGQPCRSHLQAVDPGYGDHGQRDPGPSSASLT